MRNEYGTERPDKIEVEHYHGTGGIELLLFMIAIALAGIWFELSKIAEHWK